MTRSTASSPTSGRSPPGLGDFATNRVAAGAWLLAALSTPPAAGAESADASATCAASVEAEFRGCDAAGWCRFRIESRDPSTQPQRVRPNGVPGAQADDALATALRDRLNALLASMIHQHKRIRLHCMHERGDGTFAATVTVNEADVASDPALLELGRTASGTAR